MKKYFQLIITILIASAALSQETVYPAPKQNKQMALTNAVIHVGNGTVITNGAVVFDNGKISFVGKAESMPTVTAEQVVDLKGKHIYPGLILTNSTLGLIEVAAGTRATNDLTELGELNPNIRSIVAYNSDSKIINTLRSNGVLIANVVPQGGLISGSSSVVQLDAWNWEDAAYRIDGGIHFNMPNLINRPNPFAAFFGTQTTTDPIKPALDRIENVKNFFRQASAYFQEGNHQSVNLKYEAVRGLFDKKQKFYVHCDLVKEMLVAIDFVKEFGFDVVIMGGSESYQITDLLKQNNIAVILGQLHVLPTMVDDDVDQPFKTPAMLQKAGVLFAINDDDGSNRGRNIMFNAGTAVAYGLSKEDALTAITLNAAKILGIADRTGSVEVGKDANIIVSEGDLLDMKSSNISHAFIQGRAINLDNKQKQLYERYKHKYGLQ